MFVKFYSSPNSLYLDVLKSHEKDVNSKPLFEGFSPNPVVGFLYDEILSLEERDEELTLLFDPHQHRLDDDILYATSPYDFFEYIPSKDMLYKQVNFIYGLDYLGETHIFGHLHGGNAGEIDPNNLGSFIRRVLKYRCFSNTLFGISYRVGEHEIAAQNEICDNVLDIANRIGFMRDTWKDIDQHVLDILQKTENVVKKMEGF